MKIFILGKKTIFFCLIGLTVVLVSISMLLCVMVKQYDFSTTQLLIGGRFYKQSYSQLNEIEASKIVTLNRNLEKYFRPSKLPILNKKEYNLDFFFKFHGKKASEIFLPDYLLKTPEETIINYFSILREAANPTKEKMGGCGTIGNGRLPYPIAYNFFTSSYRQKVNYAQYLKSFEGILHINLIKLRKAPGDEKHPGDIRYFVEIETIEGSDKNATYFAYYYGFMYLLKEGNLYKISDFRLFGEDFVCAPYHLWQHNAEASVDIRYGNWCKLVKERYPTHRDGYIKRIYFKGTDGNDYLVVFYQLTNDTDVEIAQYIKNRDGKWILIRLDPNKCIEKKRSDM